MDIFDYDLPAERVAQYPLPDRASSRLMVVDRQGDTIRETKFACIPSFLRRGDVLVLNDAKVVPARLLAAKPTGGRLEVFLLRKRESFVWEALLRGRFRPGLEFAVGDVSGKILARTEAGSFLVRFETDCDADIYRYGQVPLPPYIRREPEPEDRQRYQTVYAGREGAVAAPTAGLHFTRELLEEVRDAGVSIRFLTLYIGWASFRQVPGAGCGTPEVPEERFELPEDTAAEVRRAKGEGRRVIAVGTSSVRVLESCCRNGEISACAGSTGLFIQPGFRFQAVDGLVTNFHLPGSTHLSLVCAFAGTERMRRAYRTALDNGYRFYSYGDAMLIL